MAQSPRASRRRVSTERPTREPASITPRLRPETRQAILIVVLFLLAVVFLFSVFGWAGVLGDAVNKALGTLFGWLRYIVPIVLVSMGYLFLFPERYHVTAPRWSGFVVAWLAAAGLLQMFLPLKDSIVRAIGGDGGGYSGVLLNYPLRSAMGPWASGFILAGLLIIGLLVMLNTTLQHLAYRGNIPARILAKFRAFFWRRRLAQLHPDDGGTDTDQPQFTHQDIDDEQTEEEVEEPAEGQPEKTYVPTTPKRVRRPKLNIAIPIDLLEISSSQPMSGNIDGNKEKIQRTLETFGISVEMGDVNVGPTVTQFTLKPAEGVKLSQITSLSNDLALALAAHPIRIEAPIPGKSLVGIEVPNQSVALVSLRDILDSDEFKHRSSSLAFALGKDVSGKPWVANLDPLPHLLVAGATGSGKSVMINSLIISMLYSKSPDDLKLILVDPKKVELSLYNGIPHLLTPVITDTTKTINALRWVVGEMDRRFGLLSNAGKRNIASYRKEVSDDLPYIVVVIDELADLMTVAANEVEGAIVRLAQMARAVGIHLVLATQRPSVDVITGLIKANVTARIAFSVASQIDSRTILDSSGAEKLLGKGDMLFVSAELSKPRRLQGAFVSEKEVERVTQFLKSRGQPDYMNDIVEKASPIIGGSMEDLGEDELLAEAKTVISQAGKASASLLQRRLRVGYARAARLLDLLEEQGFIGPGDGAKPREVYGAVPLAEPMMSTSADEPASETEPTEPDDVTESASEPGDPTEDEAVDENVPTDHERV